MAKKFYQIIIFDDGMKFDFSSEVDPSDRELLKTSNFLFLRRYKKQGNLIIKNFLFSDVISLNIPSQLQKELLISIEILFPFSNLYCHEGPFKFDTTKPITFFGGSFNPFHAGHRECIKQCQKYESNIVVVPDYSPWKNNHFESPLEEIKYLETQLVLNFSNITIYPIFWGVQKRNPTSVWIKDIQWPSGINWLMGEDTFNSLLKWFEVDNFLCVLTKIYICPRVSEEGQQFDNVQVVSYINHNHPQVELVWLEHHESEHISSSKIRNN